MMQNLILSNKSPHERSNAAPVPNLLMTSSKEHVKTILMNLRIPRMFTAPTFPVVIPTKKFYVSMKAVSSDGNFRAVRKSVNGRSIRMTSVPTNMLTDREL